MSVLAGIIISVVVIVLTVLFIIWVLNRGKHDKNESIESKLWAYDDDYLRTSQWDKIGNIDSYFKHTNIKPDSMLIIAAVFICISILLIIAVSVFAGMS